ncbi:MAG: UDP-N-acetylmuramoyl-tripeptide--D-alanyl-D-alanine ligase [Candidatus Methylomirabilia bacterium]
MPPFTVLDIVRTTQGALIQGDLAVPVRGVSIDSRTLRVGEAFFAVRGHRLDGHDYVVEAAARGASCLIVHHLTDALPGGAPVVLVDETTNALGRLAAYHRSRFSIPVVAVTGSNGKTTVKEMIAAVLERRWTVLKPVGSFNNQWGLPLTLLGLSAGHQALVVELGASRVGEIASLTELARPTVGVVTSVSAAHTEFFQNLEGVQREKASLVRAIPTEGSVVLNWDDPWVRAMAGEARGRVVTVGTGPEAEVRAAGEIREDHEGLAFTLEIRGQQLPVRLAFSGRHNVVNSLASAGAGIAVGLSLEEIAGGLEAARPARGRLIWRRAGEIRILDDTYNANPASVRAALATLGAQKEGSVRLLVALGDMLELGPLAEAAHREVGRQVATLGVAEFIGMGPLMRFAVEEALEAGLGESHRSENAEALVGRLMKRLAPGDTLLVKGSRAMRMERVVHALVARLGGGE